MRNKRRMRIQIERRLNINQCEGEGKCWTVVSICASSCGCAGLMFGAMLEPAGSLEHLLYIMYSTWKQVLWPFQRCRNCGHR